MREKSLKLKNVKIAIVDDSSISALALGKMLNKRGAVTFTFLNGLEILNRIKEEGNIFDCIIVDIMMPKMDGILATKEIRKISNIPIIGLTAYDLDSASQLMKDVGMFSCLLKPCQITKMENLIIEAVNFGKD